MLALAIVGGGLAGGLAALAVHRAQPSLRIALFEAGETLGGNHRWSWFASDLCVRGTELLAGFEAVAWADHEVRFPAYRRRLQGGYHSLASSDFDAGLRHMLPAGAIRCGARVAALAGDGVTLQSGETIAAHTVIDCRDAAPGALLTGGWQVFLGQLLRTSLPHGIERPVIMDATVEQVGGYRFVYLLPMGPREIFVEDTYYTDSPRLDAPLLRERIVAYLAAQGWQAEVLHEESGVLPVIAGGDLAAHRASLGAPGVALAGARGGFTHPLTSYTLPMAIDNALAIAGMADHPGQLAAFLDRRAKMHWRKTRFYRLLGRMLFDAAVPDERYRIFQRFYRLPEPLIARFYAARSTLPDRLRILAGKPPVPVGRAIAALLGKGTPLVHEGQR